MTWLALIPDFCKLRVAPWQWKVFMHWAFFKPALQTDAQAQQAIRRIFVEELVV